MTQKTELQQIDLFKNLIGDAHRNKENSMDIAYYMGLIWRRRWFIIAIFCIAMISGIYLAITLPKLYQAETLILIEPQRVPNNYVQSIVSTDLDFRLENITQIVKSRTNLMDIIKKFNLFSGPAYKNLYIEDKIEKMRSLISVSLKADRRRRSANSFTISFKGKDPSNVMDVVNAITTLFINQNIKVREMQAEGTTEFLNDQLASMKDNLERVEEALGEYRKAHMGELPEQLAANLRMLDILQQQLNEKQTSLRNEKNRLSSLENQLQIAREQSKIAGNIQPNSENQNSIEALRRQLSDYKSRYTDNHPEVIRLRKRIAEMEKENGSEASIPSELILQRKGIEEEIESIKKDISKLNTQLVFYQRRVEETPKREQELLSLKRNYKNTQETYNSLLKRKLEAGIATNMEKRQKGESFRILDPGRLPEKPISPDMRKLFLICLAVALGCSGGVIFLLDFIDSSVKKPEVVSDKLGIPVLAVMPNIKHHKDIIRHRLNIACSFFAGIISLALLACFAAVTILEMHHVVELIKKYANI